MHEMYINVWHIITIMEREAATLVKEYAYLDENTIEVLVPGCLGIFNQLYDEESVTHIDSIKLRPGSRIYVVSPGEGSEDVEIARMEFYKGQIDMDLTGETVLRFYAALVKFLEQNGAENFITTTVTRNDEGFEITVRRLNAKDTPAEKIRRLEAARKQIHALASSCTGLLRVAEDAGDLDEVISLLKVIRELTAE